MTELKLHKLKQTLVDRQLEGNDYLSFEEMLGHINKLNGAPYDI